MKLTLTPQREQAKSNCHYRAGQIEGAARQIHSAILSEDFITARVLLEDLCNTVAELGNELQKLP